VSVRSWLQLVKRARRHARTVGIICGLLAASCAVVAWPSLGAGTGRVYIQSGYAPVNVTSVLYKPRKIQFYKYEYATGLRWHGWGGKGATAHGTTHIHSCYPGPCSTGGDYKRAVLLRVGNIRFCSGRWQYTLLRRRWSGEAIPGGFPRRTQYLPTRCGSFYWVGNKKSRYP
jgi:hypothetical protein